MVARLAPPTEPVEPYAVLTLARRRPAPRYAQFGPPLRPRRVRRLLARRRGDARDAESPRGGIASATQPHTFAQPYGGQFDLAPVGDRPRPS
jgi:hypothetical protein